MNPEDIARILDDLGSRLGPSGEYAFQLAVRQSIGEAVLYGLLSFIGLSVLLVIAFRGARFTISRYRVEAEAYRKGEGRWSSYQSQPSLDDYLFPWLMGGLFGGFGGAVLLWTFADALLKLWNPEYAALARILGTVLR